MTKKQIASWINNYVTKNELCIPASEGSSWVQLAEDLSNFADYGKQLSTLAVSDLENLKQSFIASIKNEFIVRSLEKNYYNMIKASGEFESSLQRIVSDAVIDAVDSHLTNLDWNNGASWVDGKYYGVPMNAKLFTKEVAWKIPYSISDDEWTMALRDENELMKVIAVIKGAVENTITFKFNSLVKRLFCAMIDKCHTDSREIHLITEFNKEYNKNYDSTDPTTAYTLKDIEHDRDLNAMFNDYCKAVVEDTKAYMGSYNGVYNDGTIKTFVPDSKIGACLLRRFASRMRFMGDPVEFHTVGMPIPYETIDSWQTNGNTIVKSYGDVSKVVLPPTTEGGDDVVISNVVGVIYDTDAVGINVFKQKETKEYIGSEGFSTFFSHTSCRFYIDTRFSMVTLLLD